MKELTRTKEPSRLENLLDIHKLFVEAREAGIQNINEVWDKEPTTDEERAAKAIATEKAIAEKVAEKIKEILEINVDTIKKSDITIRIAFFNILLGHIDYSSLAEEERKKYEEHILAISSEVIKLISDADRKKYEQLAQRIKFNQIASKFDFDIETYKKLSASEQSKIISGLLELKPDFLKGLGTELQIAFIKILLEYNNYEKLPKKQKMAYEEHILSISSSIVNKLSQGKDESSEERKKYNQLAQSILRKRKYTTSFIRY